MTKRGKIIASTNDPLGHPVVLTDKTWNHIKKQRADEGVTVEIADVTGTIAGAEIIRKSTLPFPAFGYAKNDVTGDWRVIVEFGTMNLFDKTAEGWVNTAYPIDPRYKSSVGEIIWEASEKTDQAEDASKEEEPPEGTK